MDVVQADAIILSGSPESIVVHWHSGFTVQTQLDITLAASRLYPDSSLVYITQGVLCVLHNGESITFSDRFEQITCNVQDFEYCVAVYNLQKENQLVTYDLQHSKSNFDQLPVVGLSSCQPAIPVESDVRYGHVSLSFESLHIICGRQWFTGDIIDCYFQLLSDHLPNRLLVFSCAWFGEKLLIRQDPSNVKFNVPVFTSSSLFTYDGNSKFHYVLMPLSVYNKHFILLVVDFEAKCIYYCDSMKSMYRQVVNQCVRFLTCNYACCTGQSLDLSAWSFCNYCEDDEQFPMQTDCHNCGPYVCIMAKCILLQRKLQYLNVAELRYTILQELCSGVLLL